MQLQDHDEWSGSCHSTGCLVHLAAPTFQVFPLHRFGLHLADHASDSEGVDLFQVSQGLVDLRRPGRMRPLGNDGYITCTNRTHPTKHAKIWDKNSTCKEPASTLGAKIAEIWLSWLDISPHFWGKKPYNFGREDISQLREDQGGFTATNHCSLMFFFLAQDAKVILVETQYLIVFYMAGIFVHQSRKLMNIWWITICYYYHVSNWSIMQVQIWVFSPPDLPRSPIMRWINPTLSALLSIQSSMLGGSHRVEKVRGYLIS